jgi:hypothetical protein
MLRYAILFGMIIAPAFAVTISIVEGDLLDLGNITLSPYGVVKGTIVFKVGDLNWYPKEVWLVPAGTLPETFKTYVKSIELSSQNKCTTNLYTNNSSFAFKVTESQIKNGSFCALAYNGTYELLVR